MKRNFTERLLYTVMLITAFFVDVELIRELVDGRLCNVDPFTLLTSVGVFLLVLVSLMDQRITAERRERDRHEKRGSL